MAESALVDRHEMGNRGPVPAAAGTMHVHHAVEPRRVRAVLSRPNVGFLIWFFSGIAKANVTVAAPNVVAFTVGAITTLTALRFRHHATDAP
jgi:hypothetical protein